MKMMITNKHIAILFLLCVSNSVLLFTAGKELTPVQLKKRDAVVATAIEGLGGKAIQNKAAITARAQHIAAEHIQENEKKLVARIIADLENFVEPSVVGNRWGLTPEQLEKRNSVVADAFERLGGDFIENRGMIRDRALDIASEYINISQSTLINRIVQELQPQVRGVTPAEISIKTAIQNIVTSFTHDQPGNLHMADAANKFIGIIGKANATDIADPKSQSEAITLLETILLRYIAGFSKGDQKAALNNVINFLEDVPEKYYARPEEDARGYMSGGWNNLWNRHKPSKVLIQAMTKRLLSNGAATDFF